MPIVNLEQGTSSWLDWRREVVTATDSSIIMRKNPYKDPLTLWKEKMMIKPPDPVNSAMARGSYLEPKARDYFQELTGLRLPPVVFEHPSYSWMAASLDGYDGMHLLEIKCPGERVLEECRNGNIPEYWYIQVQHQLAVTGLEWAYLFIFDGNEGFYKEIVLDKNLIERMIEEEKEFYRRMQEFDPPPEKYLQRSDDAWLKQANNYATAKIAYDEAKRSLEREKDKLVALSGSSSTEGCGVRVCRFYSKGQIDYKSIPEIKALDLEKYRKPGSERINVTLTYMKNEETFF